MCSPLPFRVSPFPSPVRGVSSPIVSSRMRSRNARTFQYRLRSNTGHLCSTIPLPPSPWIKTSLLGEKLVENDGRLARLRLRNAAKPWASICESSNSYLILFHPFLFELPGACVVQGAYTFGPECAGSLATRPELSLSGWAQFFFLLKTSGRVYLNTVYTHTPSSVPLLALSVGPSLHIDS
jgi:hypothetical protein